MAVMKEARLVAYGIVLMLGAAALTVLRAPASLSAFALTFGLGVSASSRAVLRSHRTRLAVLVALVVAFVAYRLGTIVATELTASRAAVLAVETAILTVAFGLGYEHARGLAQLAALLRRNDAGYAPVLDEGVAARTVEAELARSRRHGTPLTFLLLEPSAVADVEEFEATVRRTAPSALTELERIYARDRASALISEHVRRSDVVVSWPDHFLVMSSDTSADGTAILAERIFEAARGQLGISLRTGVAAFPTHGSTFGELIAVATAAARNGSGNGSGNGDGTHDVPVDLAAETAAEAAETVTTSTDDYEPPPMQAQASQ
jgi:hypothetical protein